jgi:hypothetical protein
MSVLFERQPGMLENSIQATRTIEPRQIPFLHPDALLSDDTVLNSNATSYPEGGNTIKSIIAKSFTTFESNWLYSATIELALSGTGPPWSKDGWSFNPVSFSALPDTANPIKLQKLGKLAEDATPFLSTVNVTLKTTALRARLDCSSIDEDIANVSSWLRTVHFKRLSNVTSGLINNSPGFELRQNMFHWPFTSPATHPGRVDCCLNNSTSDPQQIATGYWSTNEGNFFPHLGTEWPKNFTVKWIHGLASPWPADIEMPPISTPDKCLGGFEDKHSHFMVGYFEHSLNALRKTGQSS